MGANVGTQTCGVHRLSWEEVKKTPLRPLPAIEEEVHTKAKEEDPKKLEVESVKSREWQANIEPAKSREWQFNSEPVTSKEWQAPDELGFEMTPMEEDPGISRLAVPCRRIGKMEDVSMHMEVAAQNIRKMEEVIADMRSVPSMQAGSDSGPSDSGMQSPEVAQEDTQKPVNEDFPPDVIKSVMDSPSTEQTVLAGHEVDFLVLTPRIETATDFPNSEAATEEPVARIECICGAPWKPEDRFCAFCGTRRHMPEAALQVFTPPRPLSMPASPTDPLVASASLSMLPPARIAPPAPTRPAFRHIVETGQRQRTTPTPIRRTSELAGFQGKGNVQTQSSPTPTTARAPPAATLQRVGSNGITRLGHMRQTLPSKSAQALARTPPVPNGAMRGRSGVQLCMRMPASRSGHAGSPIVPPRQQSPERLSGNGHARSRMVLTPRVGGSPSRVPIVSRSSSVQCHTAQYPRVVKQSSEQDLAGFGEATAAIERASELLEKVSQRKAAPMPGVGQPTWISQAMPADPTVYRTTSTQRLSSASLSASTPSAPVPVQGNVSLSSGLTESLRFVSPPRAVSPVMAAPVMCATASSRSISPPQRLSSVMPAFTPSPACSRSTSVPGDGALPAGTLQAPFLRNAVKGATMAGAAPLVLTMSGGAPFYLPARSGSRSPSPGIRGMSVPAVPIMRQTSAILYHGSRSTSPAPRCAARPGYETPTNGLAGD